MRRLIVSCLLFTLPAFSLETPNPTDARFDRTVAAARKAGLDSDPAVRGEIDKLLYKKYTARLLQENRKDLEPTDAELKQAYEAKPLLRLRHLVLAFHENERVKAKEILTKAQRELKRGADFKKVVMRYSQDEDAKFGGDLDFRGFNALPGQVYEKALLLKMKEVSEPVTNNNGIHLFQLIDKKSYETAFPTYLQLLRVTLREAKLNAFLDKKLEAENK